MNIGGVKKIMSYSYDFLSFAGNYRHPDECQDLNKIPKRVRDDNKGF